MLKNAKYSVSIIDNGIEQEIDFFKNDYFSVSIKDIANQCELKLLPKKTTTLKSLKVKLPFALKSDDKVFSNGFQSWSTSREFVKEDKQVGITPIGKLPFVKAIASIYGDYYFYDYPKTGGIFHSHMYSYVKNNNGLFFIGSIDEKIAYTIFKWDFNDNSLCIIKDVEGLELKKEVTLINIVRQKGTYDEVFDFYFKFFNIPSFKIDRLTGYTSWYNYFQKINEDIILRDLDNLTEKSKSANIFQIDDGFQVAVGDWLNIDKEKFPNGMKFVADKIHEKKLLAGLWLAPFCVQRNSRFRKEHKDWLLKKPNSDKPLLGNFGWGGAYVFDIYNPEVREYLKKVFDAVLYDWGYDMVKLDFLYSEAIFPRNGKTRAMIMFDSMSFLRQLVGDKLLLGCGVPMAVTFGMCDACRVSCDVDISYHERLFSKLINNEIVSTRDAITNSIFRRHLNKRAFTSDPDVFFLRDNKLKFTMSQKKTLAKVNNMFGDVLFVSDNVGDYDEEKLDILSSAYEKKDTQIIDANFISFDEIKIEYLCNKKKDIFTIKLDK